MAIFAAQTMPMKLSMGLMLTGQGAHATTFEVDFACGSDDAHEIINGLHAHGPGGPCYYLMQKSAVILGLHLEVDFACVD